MEMPSAPNRSCSALISSLLTMKEATRLLACTQTQKSMLESPNVSKPNHGAMPLSAPSVLSMTFCPASLAMRSTSASALS